MALTDPRYADNSLVVNGSGIEIEKGSVNFGNEHSTDEPESGDKFQPDLDVTLGIRNMVDWTQFQPSFDSPELLTNMKFNWKLYGANGETIIAGRSKVLTKAMLVPVGFNAEKGQIAKFQRRAYALFSGGNNITDTSELLTPVKVSAPYKLNTVSIGGSALKSVRSASANYNHEVQWPPELEAEEIWINRSAVSGQIVVDDIDAATLARMKTGQVGDVVVGFINTAEVTSSETFTNCSVRVSSISGTQVTLDWKKLTD